MILMILTKCLFLNMNIINNQIMILIDADISYRMNLLILDWVDC